MNKYINAAIVVIVVAALLGVIIVTTGIGSGRMADGTYRITNCEAYPDAYLVVDGYRVQFFNIDLNALYQEKQRKDFQQWIERGIGASMTEEQIERASDLNNLFVSNSWMVDYSLDNKLGTFTYVYFCLVKDTRFGLVLQYDSLHKTIQLNDADPTKVFVFKK